MGAYDEILFERHGTIYVYLGPDLPPREITIKGHVYHRYMDRLYLPKKVGELDSKETVIVAEIRDRLKENIIDFAFTQQVLSKLLDFTGLERGRLIDFGCGAGNIVAHVGAAVIESRPKEIVGVDISEQMVSKARARLAMGKFGTAITVDTAHIGLKTTYFDAAIANFVMQFHVYEQQMRDLFRCLKPGGKFVYNNHYANVDIYHHNNAKQILERVGFVVSEEDVDIVRSDVTIREKIVVCQKKV